MDILISKIRTFMNKYKFVILILSIGLLLMVIPFEGKSTQEPQKSPASTERQETLSEQLSSILSSVQGAGRVQIILTVAEGEEVIYQTDSDHTTNDSNSSSRGDTVVISDSNRNETGLVKGTKAPQYRGAVVICDGANNPTVALALVDAVSKVTGLSTDKISVLKME